MAAEVRQPVAIRVTRPYSNEDEFLEHEIDTLTRTSVTLIGAQSRPQGVILRFEVMLASGMPLMRGEGRVIAFKAHALDDLPGLTLRFTRLDKKTKALVDRAALIREDRARAALQASMAESEFPPPMPSATALPDDQDAGRLTAPDGQNGNGHTVEMTVRAPLIPPAPVAPPPTRSPPSSSSLSSPAGPTAPSVPSSPPVPAAPAASMARDRDSLLLRLRERARGLAPETVAAILQDSPTSTSE